MWRPGSIECISPTRLWNLPASFWMLPTSTRELLVNIPVLSSVFSVLVQRLGYCLLASSDLLISKSEFSADSFVEVLDLVYLLVLVFRMSFVSPVGRKVIAFGWQTNKHQTIVRVNFAVMRFRAVLVFFSAGLELLLLGAFVSRCSLMWCILIESAKIGCVWNRGKSAVGYTSRHRSGNWCSSEGSASYGCLGIIWAQDHSVAGSFPSPCLLTTTWTFLWGQFS